MSDLINNNNNESYGTNSTNHTPDSLAMALPPSTELAQELSE